MKLKDRWFIFSSRTRSPEIRFNSKTWPRPRRRHTLGTYVLRRAIFARLRPRGPVVERMTRRTVFVHGPTYKWKFSVFYDDNEKLEISRTTDRRTRDVRTARFVRIIAYALAAYIIMLTFRSGPIAFGRQTKQRHRHRPSSPRLHENVCFSFDSTRLATLHRLLRWCSLIVAYTVQRGLLNWFLQRSVLKLSKSFFFFVFTNKIYVRFHDFGSASKTYPLQSGHGPWPAGKLSRPPRCGRTDQSDRVRRV